MLDMSYWTKANPCIAVEHTQKKFFGRYLYRLILNVRGIDLIKDTGSFESSLLARQLVANRFGYIGHWNYKYFYKVKLEDLDLTALEILRNFKNQCPAGVRLRVEEPRMIIYAGSEEILKDILGDQLQSVSKVHLHSITGPKNAETAELLNSGAILRKTDIGYRYKILFRDGRYGQEIKQQILGYLINFLPNSVEILPSTYQMLSGNSQYLRSGYFYSDSSEITQMISLICPGIILNCHELIVQDK